MNIFSLKIALLTAQVALLQFQVSQVQTNPPVVIERPQMTTEEQLVRLEFWDAPQMIDIINCESHFQQFKNGKVNKSPKNTNGTYDYGIAQINQIHLKEAEALGFDIKTLKGNLSYARFLYEREGTSPWVCSRKESVA